MIFDHGLGYTLGSTAHRDESPGFAQFRLLTPAHLTEDK